MDNVFMKRVLELAKAGTGFVNPSPLIGAVIVKNNIIIAEGYYKQYDAEAAEIIAVERAGGQAKDSTLYVNIDPCSYISDVERNLQKLIKYGVSKIVAGMEHPEPRISETIRAILRENSIELIPGGLEDECRKLNEIYIKYSTTHLPFCILKTAMSWDGKISTEFGDSSYITNCFSDEFIHGLRHRVSTVMVGIGRVLEDDPLLTARLRNEKGSDPVRVIVDSKARIPLGANVLNVNSRSKTIIAVTELAEKEKLKALEHMGAEIFMNHLKDNRVDLCYLVKELGRRKLDSILFEGGSTLNFSALNEGIIDKVISFIAPKISGGDPAKTPIGGGRRIKVKDSILLKDISVERFGDDIMIEGYLFKDEPPKCAPDTPI